MSDFFVRGGQKLVMFDLGNAEYFIRQQLKEKIIGANGGESEIMKDVIDFFTPDSWSDFGEDCPSHAATGRRWMARALADWALDAPAESVSGFDDYETVLTDKEILFSGEEEISHAFGALLEAKNPNQSEVNEHA